MSDENDYWERNCNYDEVPSLDCVDLCCMDCMHIVGCMYACNSAKKGYCPYNDSDD